MSACAENGWSRPLYTAGGDDAFICYEVFGDFDKWKSLEVSGPGINLPQDIQMRKHDLAQYPSILTRTLKYYATKNLEDSDSILYRNIKKATCCIELFGVIKDPPSLEYLIEISNVINLLLNLGGVGVFDKLRLSWWSLLNWQETFCKNEELAIYEHVKVIASETGIGDNDHYWLHTRGLRKFGRPDLSWENVSESQVESVVAVFNWLIAQQACGLLIEEGRRIDLSDFEQLTDSITCHFQGDLDDPDFNNHHLKLIPH